LLISPSAFSFLRQSSSDSTRKSYGQAWKAFCTWAREEGACSIPATGATVASYKAFSTGSTSLPTPGFCKRVKEENLCPIPTTGATIASYMAHLAERQESPHPGSQFWSAANFVHFAAGLSVPDLTLQAAKRIRETKVTYGSPAVTVDIIQTILPRLLGPGIDGRLRVDKPVFAPFWGWRTCVILVLSYTVTVRFNDLSQAVEEGAS